MERLEFMKAVVVITRRWGGGGGGNDREREYRWEKVEIAMGEGMVEVGLSPSTLSLTLLSFSLFFHPSSVERERESR